MSQSRFRDDSAIERRDQAQRRVWPITATALAGGVTVTVVAAGLAFGYAPGRAATTSTGSSSTGSSGTSTSPQAQSTDPNSQFGDDGFQSSQQPSFGGFGGYGGHAVSGGS